MRRAVLSVLWALSVALIVVPSSRAFLVGNQIELPDVPSSGFNRNDWITSSTVPPSYTPEAPGDEGAFRFQCAAGHLNWDDPILYPGILGGSPHLHHYFGNPGTNYASTYTTLRQNSAVGTCDGGPLNNTGYWFPAMIRPQNNMVVVPNFFTVYYKTQRRNQTGYVASGSGLSQGAARNLPRGLRYVMGFNTATGLIDPVGTTFFWGCEDGTGGNQATITALAAATDCTGLVSGFQARIFVRLSFGPNCWNGTQLDSPDHRSHMKSKAQDGFGNALCPTTHPIILPQLTVIIWFQHQGAADFSQWYLSSDRMPNHTQYANGESFHTDWFGGWDQTVMETWTHLVDGIAGTGTDVRDGVSAQLGDATKLVSNATSVPPACCVYSAIPARP